MRHRPLLSLLLALGCVAAVAAQTAAPRVVAIGDVHGALPQFIDILKRAGLVDERLAWAGGRATLVQTGDTTDRGPGVRGVLDLLMRLEREARAAGGQLVTLIGNHEVMNLVGDWRDVTPDICAAFQTPQSEALRVKTWAAYERLQRRHTRDGQPTPPVYAETREAWMAAHPPGCLEYRAAMSPDGVYGRWLRDKPIAARVGGSLFMHAGVSPRQPAASVDDLNDRARSEIRRFDTFRRRLVSRDLALPSFSLQQIVEVSAMLLREASDAITAAKAEGLPMPTLDLATLREAQALLDSASWSLFAPEGPLWFRGYAQWDEAATTGEVQALLDRLGLERIVVGHTVTPTRRITPRYAGRVLLIDTGMLTPVYEGTPSALEINESELKAWYPDGPATLTATPATPARAVP